MKPSAKDLYSKAKDSHESIYFALREVQHEVEKCTTYKEIEELCDYDFAIDQAHEYIEDLKRELWNLREEVNAKICTLWLGECVNNPANMIRSIHTEYVTATPNVGQSPNIPSLSKEPEAFKQLMEFVGIDISTWSTNEKGELEPPVKFHWPGLVALVTKNLSAGKPVPPGIDLSKLKPVFKVALRKRRGVLEDADSESLQSLQEQLKNLEDELSSEEHE